MAVLQEYRSFDQANAMVESVDSDKPGQKNWYMRGIFIQGGVRNHNGRVYPVAEIRSAVDQVNEQLRQNKSILGECDHPAELNINLDRVSHMITEMYMDGNNGIGKLKVLQTPMGNIIASLLESDVKLGVSSRGSGDVDAQGNVSGFEIITVDIVCQPSGPNCFPVALKEAFNSKRGYIINDLAESVTHDPKAQKYFKKELLDWINKL